MSVSEQIQAFNDGLLDAYDTVRTKGGTVPASKNLDNLPDAIVSISGGGSDPFLEKLQAFADVVNNSGKMSASYNKTYDTTDTVTLYTPDANCQHYCIQYRSSGKFRALWFPYSVVGCGSTSGYGITNAVAEVNTSIVSDYSGVVASIDEPGALSYSPQSHYSIATNSAYPSPNKFFDAGTVFYTSEMNTIEECIEALKNSSTAYTSLSSASFMAGERYGSTGSSIVASNLLEFSGASVNGLDTPSPVYTIETNISGRQISSNETIVVQGNA